MKFSVIIPVYNTEKFLPECLDSVINQNYSDLEIIIVNDGSPDNSDEICRSYAARDPRIKYIIQANQGVAIARNNGMSAATGDYIYCIDSDDSIAQDFFYELNRTVTADPADVIIIGTEFCRTKIENLGAVATNGIAVKAGFLKKYPDVRFAEKMHPGEDGIFAHKALHGGNNLALGGDIIALGEHIAGHILGVGGPAEKQGRQIVLIRGEHKLAGLNSALNKDGQNAGRHWIKSACVSGLRSTEYSLDTINNTLRGGANLFVYYNNSVLHYLLRSTTLLISRTSLR